MALFAANESVIRPPEIAFESAYPKRSKADFCKLDSSSPEFYCMNWVKKDVVHFFVRENRVAAWILRAKELPFPAPAIVMGPGFSGVKDCFYDLVADDFAAAGYQVVLFDYPGFGDSDGLPRQEVNYEIQIETYRAAVDFLFTTLPDHISKVGLWGGSYSGSHALVAAATDDRIACLVAMTPFVSGSTHWQNLPEKIRVKLSSYFAAEAARLEGGSPAGMVPVVANDPHVFCMLPGKPAYHFGMLCQDRSAQWLNEVTVQSIAMHFKYDPIHWARDIKVPCQVQIASNDELIPAAESDRLYRTIAAPIKELKVIPGDHFSPFLANRKETTIQAIDWFDRHLK